MDHTSYLAAVRADPWRAFPFPTGCSDLPSAWIAEAWDLAEVQATHAQEMVRDVNKNGTFQCSAPRLRVLLGALRSDQVAALYLIIRDSTPYREEEFRRQFEADFARHVHALPRPLTRDEICDAMGLDEASARHLLDGEPYYG